MSSRVNVIALIVADPAVGRLGNTRRLDVSLAGESVWWHTLQRAARIQRATRIVVVHPPNTRGHFPAVDSSDRGKPVEFFEHPEVAGDAYTARTRSARKWALSGWRGGLAGATAWDELLPAAPLAAAMERFNGEAAAIVGGDWCAFDPALADELLKLHLGAPEAMKLTLTQAPPGLSPIVTSRAVLREFAEKQATFGSVLAYNPKRPALDPIGRECNLPIPASIRDTARRFIADDVSSGHTSPLQRVAAELGDDFAAADAVAITDACRGWELAHPEHVFDDLPGQITLELSARRLVDGPITVQHDVDLPRGEMDFELACDLLGQCTGKAVTLGGHGDALLHPRWPELVRAAAEAGVMGLHVETDLLNPREDLALLTGLPIDIISVRLNADTAATYATVMGADRLPEVMGNLQWLFDRRGEVREAADKRGPSPLSKAFPGAGAGVLPGAGVPWIVPRLVKTAATLKDMELFFERWMQVVGHAVIDRPPTLGTGSFALRKDQSPVPMDPPWKPPSPFQVKQRLTVLSDGTVALCSQDALGRAALGSAKNASLGELWRYAAALEIPGGVDDSPVCRRCYDWWQMHRAGVAVGGGG